MNVREFNPASISLARSFGKFLSQSSPGRGESEPLEAQFYTYITKLAAAELFEWQTHSCFSTSAFIFFPFASYISEESVEDVEGLNETPADPEEPTKEQESGGDKDQNKWTGGFCFHSYPKSS